MALFTKTLEELRDAFVRTKFASNDERYGAFECALIESSVQTALVDPKHGPDFLKRQFGNELAEAVQQLASMNLCLTMLDSADVLDYVRNRTKPNSASQAILLMLHGRNNIQAVYPTYSNDSTACDPFIVECGGQDLSYRLIECTDQGIRDAQVETALDCIFWTILNNGPRAEVAYKFIQGACETRINAARTAAEEIFNSAVAVSADGTKLVHADEVWVLRDFGGLTYLVGKFPAERFRDHKILRPDMIIGTGSDSRFVEKGGAIPTPEGIYEEFDHVMAKLGGKPHIYLVHKKFVPAEVLAEVEDGS